MNTWLFRQGLYVFFIIQLLPNVVFHIRGFLGVSTPFLRLFGHRFWLLPEKWSNWRLTNLMAFYELLVLCRGFFSNSYSCTVHAWQAWRKSLHGVYSDLFCQKVADLRLILIAVGFIKTGKLIVCAIIDLPRRLLIRQVRGFIHGSITASYPEPVYSNVHSDALFLSDYSEGIKVTQTKKTGILWRMMWEILKETEGMLPFSTTGFLLEQLMVSWWRLSPLFGNPKVHSV